MVRSVCGSRRRHAAIVLALSVAAITAPGRAPAQSHLPELTPEQVRFAVAMVDSFKNDVRGPYLRIRWFCNDGTVQLPQPEACSERGGGNQHAELKPATRRLGSLGLNFGTILTGTPVEELFDEAHANDRLKQLVLENYLIETDDGWVLRRARFYRGARQAEDEEAAGTLLLESILTRSDWLRDNYWLANRLVAQVPHIGAGGDQLVHRIRNLASEVAELEPAFLPARIKIHSFPSREDLAAVDSFLSRTNLTPRSRTKLNELRAALVEQYDAAGRADRVVALGRAARLGDLEAKLAAAQEQILAGRYRTALEGIAEVSSGVRQAILSGSDRRLRLRRMDLNLALQEQGMMLAQRLLVADPPRSRAQRLRELVAHLEIARAGGFLSDREFVAVADAIGGLAESPEVEALEYRGEVAYVTRALDWAVGTVRSATTPALQRFTAVEPRTLGFLDAIVRGSILLPLSAELSKLSEDSDAQLESAHDLFGREPGPGVRGLNPGVARGRLEFLDEAHPEEIDRGTIYLVPETIPELRPVAGVLTLDAGNLLSHVQLLARNLAIPNAAIPARVKPLLDSGRGEYVFYAVSPLGRVVLKDTASMSPAERDLVEVRQETRPERVILDTSKLRLEVDQPIQLANLRAHDSGVLVGPKAANLGQLAVQFRDRVSAGMALPFGMFLRHVDRPYQSERTVPEDLAAAYSAADSMTAAGASEQEIDQHMFRALEQVRNAILALEWIPEMRDSVVHAMDAAFGGNLSAGIFVRSDTNVEDLPQFSGAGLNLTVPNQRTIEDILASIKRVWTSPFAERAYLWRKQVLIDQGRVYPSVLLLRSVASQKSGVLISSGLQHGSPEDMTIATAEGVGGAVDGGEAEMVIVRPNHAVRLLSQARAPTRRVLAKDGGAYLAPSRKPETLLAPEEIAQLLDIVASWKASVTEDEAGRVWDFEFGVVDGHVWLFQVRPFVRFRSFDLLQRLSVLDRDAERNAERLINLTEAF